MEMNKVYSLTFFQKLKFRLFCNDETLFFINFFIAVNNFIPNKSQINWFKDYCDNAWRSSYNFRGPHQSGVTTFQVTLAKYLAYHKNEIVLYIVPNINDKRLLLRNFFLKTPSKINIIVNRELRVVLGKRYSIEMIDMQVFKDNGYNPFQITNKVLTFESYK